MTASARDTPGGLHRGLRSAGVFVVERWGGDGEPPTPNPVWFLNPVAWLALGAIRGYQVCVPASRKPTCRFTPSCSNYMALAIMKYGVAGGVRAGLRRVRRCIGFGGHGEDWP